MLQLELLRTTLLRHWRGSASLSTDGPNLITTQELLFCSVSFAAQSLSAYTSRNSSLAAAGNDHARCGLCTRYRTARRAPASSPHVARVISQEALDKILHVRSVRPQISEHTIKIAQPRFLLIVDWFVTITLSGIFHSRACHTFRRVPHNLNLIHKIIDPSILLMEILQLSL